MKLLLLLSSLDRGGAETHLCTLATSLARRGISVTVVSSGGELAEQLLREGIVHRTLPLHSRSPLAWTRSYFALRKMLQASRYDLIHAHSRIPAFLICSLARRKNIPLITTVHASFRVNRLLRRFSRWGDYSIAVSEDLKQYLCENYTCSAERIEVIPNGIDTAHFCPDPKKSRRLSHRLLFVSRLDEDCSEVAFHLCRLAPKLKECFHDLQIVLVGGGSALPRLRALSEQMNRGKEVPLIVLKGHLSDVRNEYRCAHTVLGVSRVALEAMSCGTPVILAGNEGFGGFILSKDLPNASASNFCCRGNEIVTEERLYDAIVASFSLSPKEQNELSNSLIQYVRTLYDSEAVTTETLRVYEKVLAERQTRGPELLLCGYYGYGNLGDHALLRAAAERVRNDLPHTSFCALTAHGARDEPLFGVCCVPRSRPLLILRRIRTSKKLVFGGGTLLQDRTSLRSLLYYIFLLRYAQRHGVSTELWANGLAPPRTPLARTLLARTLAECHRIGLRDQGSLLLVTELCPHKQEIFCESDLAENTKSSKDERVFFLQHRYRLLNQDGTLRPYAIVAPRGRETSEQIRIFSWWLEYLQSKGIFLLFVPLFPKEDESLCSRLASRFGGIVAHGLSEGDLVGLMTQCRCVASMRFHGLIFARIAGVPFVGFGEDPKIETYCREHGALTWKSFVNENKKDGYENS